MGKKLSSAELDAVMAIDTNGNGKIEFNLNHGGSNMEESGTEYGSSWDYRFGSMLWYLEEQCARPARYQRYI